VTATSQRDAAQHTNFLLDILVLDATAARVAGSLSDQANALGRHPGSADVAIAALASHAACLLLNSNLRHFEPLGIACADPMAQLPA
jgi:predicted nucleic acid-binding protein